MTKLVPKHEVSNGYIIKTYIIYKNHKFLLECWNSDRADILCTDNPKLAVELGGEKFPYGKDIYILNIDRNEIEDVIEEYRPKSF